MIDKLTPEQEKKLEQQREKWMNLLFGSLGAELDKPLVTQKIKELYKFCNLEEPEVEFADSPYDAQIIANKLMGKTGKDMEYQMFGSYINISDYGWLSFYEFFMNEFPDIIPDDLKSNLQFVIGIVTQKIYDTIQMDKVCVVVRMPVALHTDSEGRMHNTKGAAIEFADGYGQHYVHGRFMEADLFNKCMSVEGAREVFFGTENEDIKANVCVITRDNLGERGLLDMLQADLYKEEVIEHNEEYKETLRLYRTKQSFPFLQDSKGNANQPYCWLEYTCPSTGAIYLIDTFADFKTPLEAAKFHRPASVPFDLPYAWPEFAN